MRAGARARRSRAPGARPQAHPAGDHAIPALDPSGAGKRSLVQWFVNTLYNKDELKNYVLTVDCAQGKGIKFIRSELKFFAKTNNDKFFFNLRGFVISILEINDRIGVVLNWTK